MVYIFSLGDIYTRTLPQLAGAVSALSAAVLATFSCHVVSSHGSKTVNMRLKILSLGHCLWQFPVLAVSRSATQLFALIFKSLLIFPQNRVL